MKSATDSGKWSKVLGTPFRFNLLIRLYSKINLCVSSAVISLRELAASMTLMMLTKFATESSDGNTSPIACARCTSMYNIPV